MTLSQRVLSCLNEASNKSCNDKVVAALKDKVGMTDQEIRYFLDGGSGYEPAAKSAAAKAKKFSPRYEDDEPFYFWKDLGISQDEVDGMLTYRGLID